MATEGVDQVKMDQLVAMGFSYTQAKQALTAHGNDLEKSIDSLIAGKVYDNGEMNQFRSLPRTQHDINNDLTTGDNNGHQSPSWKAALSSVWDTDSGMVDDDPDLAEAMQNSLQDLRERQETGVVDVSGHAITGIDHSSANPNFRPVVASEHYAPDKWALVPAGGTHDLHLEPNIPDQIKEDGLPTLIKPIPSFKIGSSLIQVLGYIPRFRNFLVQLPALDLELADPTKTSMYDTLVQMQVVVMLLEESPKAYVVIDTLVEKMQSMVSKLTNISASDNVSSFMETWRAGLYLLYPPTSSSEIESNIVDDFVNLFWTIPLMINVNNPAEQWTDTYAFCQMSVKVSEQISRNQYADLYDALDHTIWREGELNPTENYLKRVSDICIISLEHEKGNYWRSGCGVSLPELFYPERYSEANRAIILSVLARRKQLIQDRQNLEVQKKSVEMHEGKPIVNILEQTSDYIRTLTDDIGNAEQIENLCNSIKLHQSTIELQSKEIDASLAQIDQELSQEMKKLSPYDVNGVARYSDVFYLCGVIIGPGIVYFANHTPDVPTPTWWYATFATTSFSHKVCRSSVLEAAEAARDQGNEIIAIYCRSSAWDEPLCSVSDNLRAYDIVQDEKTSFTDALNAWNNETNT